MSLSTPTNPIRIPSIETRFYHPTLQWGLVVCGLLGVMAIHMAWHVHPVAAFTNNAFDLAEFTSLHPATQAESPALLSSILLRLPLVLLAVAIALAANRLRWVKARWLWRGFALLVALRLNPPQSFYKSPSTASLNDKNLAQMTALGVGLVLAVILLGRWLQAIDYPLLIIIWGGMALAGWQGLSRSTRTIESLQIDVSYGAGFYGLLVVAALAIGLCGLALVGQRRIDMEKR